MCVDNPSTLFVVAVFTSLMRLDVFVVGFFFYVGISKFCF